MKLLSLIIVSIFSVHSMAATAVLSCKVTEVLDSSVFEESLSVDEYPNIVVTSDEFDGFEVTIGSSLFNLDNYNSITQEPSVGMDRIYKITNSNDDEVIHVISQGISRQGQITVKSSNKEAVVATMDCK